MFNWTRKLLKQTAFLGTFGLVMHDKESYMRNLGIMGYIGKDAKAINVIIDGLEKIPNNDYDASGVATLHGNEARITKYINTSDSDSLHRIRTELFTHEGSTIGIGHTHISKANQKTDAKAHPQCDHNNRIYVVHNGSFTNSKELRTFIENRGIKAKTESNTELLAIMIGIFVDDGHPLKIATRLAMEKIEGTWGLVAMDKMNPDQLIVARKGSKLFLGVSPDEFIVSSDRNAISADKVIELEDSNIYTLDPKAKRLESLRVKDKLTMLSLGEHAHWTIKEIKEQPEAIARAINFGARLTSDSTKLKGLEEIKNDLLSVKNLVLIGCGSSFHCCQFGSHIMKSLNLMDTVTTMNPSSSFHSLPYINPGAIAISGPGNTAETIAATQLCINRQIPTISIVNAVSSPLALLTRCGVYMNAGQEIAEAATKSFICSCVVLTEIALWISYFRNPERSEQRMKLVSSLLALPLLAGSVIERSKEAVKGLAKELKDEKHMFILGRGMGESIAYEGASIISHLSKIHVEGYAGGALKHGPFALIDEGRAIILIILDDEHKEMMNLALAEVQARHAKTIVITPNMNLITTKEKPHKVILIEENGPLTGLLAVIPLQLFAYYSSIQREIDPDCPNSTELSIQLD